MKSIYFQAIYRGEITLLFITIVEVWSLFHGVLRLGSKGFQRVRLHCCVSWWVHSFLQEVDGFKGDFFFWANANIRHYFLGESLPKLPYNFILFDSPQVRNLMIPVCSPRGFMGFLGRSLGTFVILIKHMAAMGSYDNKKSGKHGVQQPGQWNSLKKNSTTFPETNIAPEHKPSQNKISIPTIHFQVRKC